MIGSSLAHYRIEALLGKGGMGEVYRARDTRLERDVALKVLPAQLADDPARKARFQREARAIAALNHRNIVTIYSVELDGERPFLTMELVPGADLAALIPEGGFPLTRCIHIAIQIADALEAANAQGVIHRDLKPANVMVTPDDEVRLLDFGLAKLREKADQDSTHAGTQALTQDGMIFGTVAYMSPEQLEGIQADHRSDVFALGVLLYQMATGRKPFDGATSAAVMSAILRDEPTAVTTLCPELPTELERALANCLAKLPARRYQTATELKRELRRIPLTSAAKRDFVLPQADPSTSAESDEKSVAVLPFTDLSQSGDQEYFCDGMTEEIINALTGVSGLKVAARTSSFQFKGKELDIREIGRELGVELVLEGSVRTAGQRLRVTAQLIKVSDGYHLWSERFDRTQEDVFAIQDEIAEAIAKALAATVRESGIHSAAKRHSGNVEAYRYYLRGRHWWNQRGSGVLPKAIEFFRKAIDEDPEYALAYSGLADCYNVLGFYGFEESHAAFSRARAAAEQALTINPMQAEAYASRGYARHHNDWRLDLADQDFRRAIELNPDYAVARQWHGVTLLCLGKGREALDSMLYARELDPLSQVINTATGWIQHMLGNYDAARLELQRAQELGTEFPWLHHMAGLNHLALGDPARAEEELRTAVKQTERASYTLGGLGHFLGATGRSSEALEIVSQLSERRERGYVAANHIASIHAGLGDADQALAWLERAVQERAGTVIYAPFEFEFASLRADERFARIVTAMGSKLPDG